MRQSEIFDRLLNRAISAEVAVVQERAIHAVEIATERARADEAVKRAADLANERVNTINVQDVHDLMRFMARGQKIDAIKAYRAITGFKLVESKDAVEAVMDRVRE